MQFLKKNKENNTLVCISVLLFLAFLSFCIRTPLAGDDWDYAVQFREYPNVISNAIMFYNTWSGRFMSEIWCFFVNSHKEIWNVVCPLMLTSIYVLLNLLINPKKNGIIIKLLIAFLMLSVGQTLRTETYTWVTGSCYLVPLLLALIYFVLIKPSIVEKKDFSIFKIILCVIINLWIGLTSENIAVTLLFANLLLLVYCIFKNNKFKNKISVFLVVSIISLIISRLSPGANYRLTLEGTEWMNQSIFEMIQLNFNNLLTYSFYNNRTLMTVVSFCLILFSITKFHNRKFHCALFCGIHSIQLLFCLSEPIYNRLHLEFLQYFFNYESNEMSLLICGIFYILYLAVIVYQVFQLSSKNDRDLGLFIALLAGCSNVVMLVSPIFGARSSLYYVFFMFALMGVFLSDMEFPKILNYGAQLSSVVAIVVILVMLNKQYTVVDWMQQQRIKIITEYQEHWDYGDIYLPQFPLNFVHGGNISDDDEFHMNAFKEYYKLNPKNNVYFYEDNNEN